MMLRGTAIVFALTRRAERVIWNIEKIAERITVTEDTAERGAEPQSLTNPDPSSMVRVEHRVVTCNETPFLVFASHVAAPIDPSDHVRCAKRHGLKPSLVMGEPFLETFSLSEIRKLPGRTDSRPEEPKAVISRNVKPIRIPVVEGVGIGSTVAIGERDWR
jgi:hypothetical protein